MQRANIKTVAVYAALIAAVVLSSFLDLPVADNENFIRIYRKFTFTVPVLFLVSVFLAFKIAETRIVLISLSLLILPLSGQVAQFLAAAGPAASGDRIITTLDSFGLLPLLLPFTLSLIFLIPEKIGKTSTTAVKVILAFLPVVCVLFGNHAVYSLFESFRYGRFLLPWPVFAAAVFPLVVSGFYGNRRFGIFSAALTSALILFMLPVILPPGGFLRETCFLFAGIILLHSLYRVYWENSYIDELTGLFNRRALNEKLRKLRNGYALAMVDVDHFKNFNDTYGHGEGDNVLRLVARILSLRFGTSAFRYGGEEFCVVFMKTNLKSAAEKMDEARADIESHMFSIRTNAKRRKKSGKRRPRGRVKKVKLTVSAGVAAPVTSTRDASEVLKHADKVLYVAKKNGRNRVEINRSRG